MIDTPEALRSLIAQARRCATVALDTEFVWESTYYPKLGVVQLGLENGDCHLIDAVALNDLTPLGEVLAAPEITKILHDAPQDLMILRRVTSAYPRAVFDTRCAAGLAGLTSTSSLLQLATTVLGMALDKTESRTNWLQRPLTAEQVQYALEDVRCLPPLRDALLQRVQRLGRESWLREELLALDDPRLYEERDPRQMYQRVKGAGRATPRELAILREVAAWREEEARLTDRPRGRVLSDEVLVHVALRKPRTADAIAPLRLARRYREVILELVARGQQVPSEELPARRPRARPGERARLETRVRRSLDHLRHRSESQEIDAPFVATRAEVHSLVSDGASADPSEHRILRGWRGEFIGQELLGQLTAES